MQEVHTFFAVNGGLETDVLVTCIPKYSQEKQLKGMQHMVWQSVAKWWDKSSIVVFSVSLESLKQISLVLKFVVWILLKIFPERLEIIWIDKTALDYNILSSSSVPASYACS